MDIRKLQRAIVDGLEDVKAQRIAVFNTAHLSPLFERVIVATGASNRQTQALAASVRDAVRARGFPVLSVEGAENGEWIIVDCGAAVAHIMQPAIRDYYHLEEIWGGKAVRMKLSEVRSGVARASSTLSSEEEDAPAQGEPDEAADAHAPPRPAPRRSRAALSASPVPAPGPSRGDKVAGQTTTRTSTKASKPTATQVPARASTRTVAKKAAPTSAQPSASPAGRPAARAPRQSSGTSAAAAPGAARKRAPSRPAGPRSAAAASPARKTPRRT